MKSILLLASALLLLSSCAQFKGYPTEAYKVHDNTKPDYSNLENWAASPFKKDPADRTPDASLIDVQDDSPVDVFFVHPTIYTGYEKDQTHWNASLADTALNGRTDRTTILHQASVFNGTGRVFAPRYRQAHLYTYYSKPDEYKYGYQALELAYHDVKSAFEYYLKNHNNGRPIIIASHSQGTTHSIRLLTEYFDNKDLKKQLVAAYLVGMPVPADTFQTIKPCQTPEETGCFCTWNTYHKGYKPKHYDIMLYRSVATNPLLWTTDDTYADFTLNKGSTLASFTLKENLVDAQAVDGLVWVSKPRLFYKFIIFKKNWHVADYNLFYINIRENAQLRVKRFLGN